jgi:hypothetical protein
MLQSILTTNIEEVKDYIVKIYDKNDLFQWFNKKQKNIFIIDSVILQKQQKYLAWNIIMDSKKYRMICRNKENASKYDFYECIDEKVKYYGSANTIYTDKHIIQFPYEIYNTIIEMCDNTNFNNTISKMCDDINFNNVIIEMCDDIN